MNSPPQAGSPVSGVGGVPGNLLDAWELARRNLRGLDPVETSRRAGVDAIPDGVKVRYLRDVYAVNFACGEVRSLAAPDRDADIMTATVLAHYLITADGRPLTDTYASYREFPGAAIYYGPFIARTVNPLVRAFGATPERLFAAAEALGGARQELGDAAVTLPILPKLPVTYVIWQGDDEIPASGSVLFDSSAPGYLPLEDLVIVAAHGARALTKVPVGGEGV